MGIVYKIQGRAGQGRGLGSGVIFTLSVRRAKRAVDGTVCALASAVPVAEAKSG